MSNENKDPIISIELLSAVMGTKTVIKDILSDNEIKIH